MKAVKPKGFKIYLFIYALDMIKQKYCITITDKITSDVAARRIAILTADCYLKHGGDINRVSLRQRQIYEAVKMLNLSCDPIPEEIRAKKMGWSREEFNPLKLSSIEGEEKYLTTYTPLIALIIRKLNTAKKETMAFASAINF